MNKGTWLAVLALLLAWTGVARAADATPSPDEEYEKKIHAAQETSPLGSDFTGEQVSLYDGSTTFAVTDVDLPGNNALPVRIGRRFKVEDRRNEGYLTGFSDWDLDLPRIQGVFLADRVWTIKGDAPYARCSRPDLPDFATSGVTINATDVWQGSYLYLPGQGDQELLINDQSKLPAITDGQAYPWVTANFARVRCLTQTASGYPGEAFVAVTADGVQYTFNYVVSRPTQPIKLQPSFGTQPVTMGRARVSFLPTRVEDRFGNSVTYAYDGDKLKSISASDGRLITLTWNGEQIQSVTANGRTWTYTYTPVTGYAYAATLSHVTQPDGAKWTYSAIGTLKPLREAPVDGGQYDCQFESDPRYDDTGYHLTIGHPSGATVVLDFDYRRTERTHTPVKQCFQPGVEAPTPYAAHYWDGYGLNGKTISGPGLASQHWGYGRGGEVSPMLYATGSATDPCPTCQQSKTITVTEPDGSYQRYQFGVMYGLNEGKLLQVEHGQGTAAPLSTTVTQYVSTSEVASQRFPDVVGSSRNLVYSFGNRLRPVKQTVLTQDGVNFQSTVPSTGSIYDFDAFARMLNQNKASSLGSKTDATTYADNLSKWVLGQVGTVTCTAPVTCAGMVESRTDYDATTALPIRAYSFGKLQQTLTYNADGTLATVKDGNNNATTLSSWYRGIPRSIKYADNSIESAVVDANGWITSTTDENGYATGYGYDAMGRLASTVYPTGDSVAYNTRYSEFRPVAATDWMPQGISAGQWRHLTWQGNIRKVTYFDALWRPVLQHEYDEANIPGTLRSSSTAYDADGRVAFQSYPSNAVVPPATGIRTIYDAFGRVTRVEQDSELGVLASSTVYQSGFKTLVTNPRGFQTTTSYLAYDQPSTDWPVAITHPEGAYTDIVRDVFGKPTSVKRRNAGSTVAATRSYVYDANQQLCKTIEPETASTVMSYDAAGNLAWSASGQALTSTTACQDTSVAVANRTLRSYDLRNRVSTLSFPDSNGNQNWSYTPDGLPAQVTTWNDGGTTTAINAYTYNKRRLLTGESITQPGWYTWGIGYAYDANAHLTGHSYPTGLYIDYAPNALGQATKAGSYATGVSYFPNGGIQQFTYGNGIVHTMTQNTRQMPDRSKDVYGASPAVLDDSYNYDFNGNVAAISDGIIGNRGNRTMSYDGLDRLLTTTSPMYGSTGATYTYDVLDNLKTVKAPGRDYTYVYDGNNRLTNVTNTVGGASVIGLGYDVQGNLNNKNGQVYTFDYGNRLRGATNQESYRYDALGHRILSWSPTLGNILSQYSQAGQLLLQQNQRLGKNLDNIYLGGSLVAQREQDVGTGAVTIRYQHTDALGSPVAVTSSTRAVLERSEYEPFGKLTNRTLTDGPGFTGHVSDAATGMINMQQRYYDPGIGRFLSVDPVTADTNTGWNFNRYWYANNNPYRFTDPDGRKSSCNAVGCVDNAPPPIAEKRVGGAGQAAQSGSMFHAGGTAFAQGASAQGSGGGTLNYGGYPVRNPSVRSNLESLRGGLDTEGHADTPLTVTGGESYVGKGGKVRSLRDDGIITNRKSNSAHNIENGSRAVDLRATNISHQDFIKIVLKYSEFRNNTNDYDDKHEHLGLPNSLQYQCPPSICISPDN